jgi:thioesterase domain-containing protein
MQIRAEAFDGDSLSLLAPLAANVNDKDCAFGGSLASVMTLAAWGWLMLRTAEAGQVADVYVADSQIRYLSPLYSDLRAVARLAEDEDWGATLRCLAERGRARGGDARGSALRRRRPGCHPGCALRAEAGIMRSMFRRLSLLLTLLPLLLLAACSSMPRSQGRHARGVRPRRPLERWELAWQIVDPAMRKSLVLPGEEQDRLQDVKVTGYHVRTAEPQPDGTIKQLVEIHYVDQATQIERVKRVNEIWRTDDDGEHWWLTTGLPEF